MSIILSQSSGCAGGVGRPLQQAASGVRRVRGQGGQAAEMYKCLLTVSGIGPRTASELVISIEIADFPGYDRLASCCGPAPRNRQSGTSISSVSASRQGSKRLRNRSYSHATAWRVATTGGSTTMPDAGTGACRTARP